MENYIICISQFKKNKMNMHAHTHQKPETSKKHSDTIYETESNTSVGKDVERFKHLCVATTNVKWYSCFFCWFLKKLIEVPCDPTILFQGIYSRNLEAGTQRDTCTSVFTPALLTIARRWKQCKYPLTD